MTKFLFPTKATMQVAQLMTLISRDTQATLEMQPSTGSSSRQNIYGASRF